MTTIICPITNIEIEDPVICPDGHTYERSALEHWVRLKGKSPMNPSMNITLDQIVPNYALRPESFSSQKNNTIISDSIEYKSPDVFFDSSTSVVEIVNPLEGPRLPRDCIICVDKSGSMMNEVKIKTADDVDNEDHGLSTWDITIHAVITSLHTLCPKDRATIVLFSNNSELIIPVSSSEGIDSSLFSMTEQNRSNLIKELKKYRPGGGTNLYSGIKLSLDILELRTDKTRESTILLFTDGQPTRRPPLGEVEELRRYIASKENNIPTLHTFGFGNNVQSSLLYYLSKHGQGFYNFIPDASFLGTIFVNAMANILSSYTSNTRIQGDTDNIKIGPMQYGQNRWAVINNELSDLGINDQDVSVIYSQKNKEEIHIGTNMSLRFSISSDILGYDAMLRCLHKCIELCNSDKWNEAESLINKTINNFSLTPYTLKLCADLEGEVSKAITQKYYFKWGKHWLYSLLRAHELQVCNNFMDPGVQGYGGQLYRELMEEANTIFNSLPAPEPSIKRSTTVVCRSMSYYNNSSAPCFHGYNIVKMYNGEEKLVSDISKGDKVITESGKIATVRCVLKTHCRDGTATLVRIPDTGLLVTQYHPIKHKNTWVHPCKIGRTMDLECKAVYSFLLDQEHTMIINNNVVICLAHHYTEGILDHWYYGTDKVTEFLMSCPGWNDGLVQLKTGCIKIGKNNNFEGLNYNFE